jgi:hypothetical protein
VQKHEVGVGEVAFCGERTEGEEEERTIRRVGVDDPIGWRKGGGECGKGGGEKKIVELLLIIGTGFVQLGFESGDFRSNPSDLVVMEERTIGTVWDSILFGYRGGWRGRFVGSATVVCRSE